MNSTTRARLLTLGALVLVLAITASAQPPQPGVCTTYSAGQTIVISTDATPEGVKAAPDPACVRRNTSVSWTSNDGEWATDFYPNSPFRNGRRGHLGKAKERYGDRIKRCRSSDSNYNKNRGGCVYKYSVSLTTGDRKQRRKDPDIIIELEP